jgi:hypothetical protein
VKDLIPFVIGRKWTLENALLQRTVDTTKRYFEFLAQGGQISSLGTTALSIYSFKILKPVELLIPQFGGLFELQITNFREYISKDEYLTCFNNIQVPPCNKLRTLEVDSPTDLVMRVLEKAPSLKSIAIKESNSSGEERYTRLFTTIAANCKQLTACTLNIGTRSLDTILAEYLSQLTLHNLSLHITINGQFLHEIGKVNSLKSLKLSCIIYPIQFGGGVLHNLTNLCINFKDGKVDGNHDIESIVKATPNVSVLEMDCCATVTNVNLLVSMLLEYNLTSLTVSVSNDHRAKVVPLILEQRNLESLSIQFAFSVQELKLSKIKNLKRYKGDIVPDLEYLNLLHVTFPNLVDIGVVSHKDTYMQEFLDNPNHWPNLEHSCTEIPSRRQVKFLYAREMLANYRNMCAMNKM